MAKWSKWLLIVLGTISWSWTMVKSGWVYSFGMGFWGANGHDGIWHIALIENLSRGSFSMPVFGGSYLQNYHLGFDLLVAFLHKISNVAVVNLYFQILPPIFALSIGYLTYKFTLSWTKSKSSAWWSTFFVYFGGGFGFLLGKGESTFWSQQAISSLINPPFALSLILILLGLVTLQRLVETKKSKYLVLCILCFGLLMEVKIYSGLLVLGGLLCVVLFELIKNKFHLTTIIRINIVKIFLGSLILSLILFFLFEKGSGSLLVWQPFWFLETMMGLSDRVGWLKFFSAINTYKSGHIWAKLIPAYFVALVIFYVGNLGTRIVKELLIWKWLKNIKKIGWFDIFSSSIIIAGVVVPMFFLQKGTPWNTIQFFYYSLFFSAILAGVAVAEFIKYSKQNTYIIYIIEVVIILLTIPTTIFSLKDIYIPMRPPAMLPNDEIFALNFLSKQPDGVVLTYPFDPIAAKIAEASPPRPLYLYVSTAYVSAFSKHQTFLEDEVNLDITGYDWQTRRTEIEAWYKEPDQIKAQEFLKSNNIKYVYWLKDQRAVLGDKQLGLIKVFENPSVIIYRVATPSD